MASRMKRLLFVDDEPELTEVVREYLHDTYDVMVADSACLDPSAATRRRVPRHRHARTRRDRSVETTASL
jgi:CheY-like chemotaxis protein